MIKIIAIATIISFITANVTTKLILSKFMEDLYEVEKKYREDLLKVSIETIEAISKPS